MPLTTNLGICTHCYEEVPKNINILRSHLKKCKEIPAENRKFETLFSLLKIQYKFNSDFWMVIFIKNSVTLWELEDFLLDIWLRCCEHESDFIIKNRAIEFDLTISNLSEKYSEFEYIYDYGNTSYLHLSFIKTDKEYLSEKSDIKILFRNKPIVHKCSECDKPAVCFCWQCNAECSPSLFCEIHRDNHEIQRKDDDEEHSTFELSNTPRGGMCCYTGPEKELIEQYFPKEIV
jgi:hypothetical protein